MAPRLVRPYLEDIVDAITKAESAIEGRSFDAYRSEWTLKYAVERAVEIISEASRRIPEPLRATQPQVPWQQVIGVGNVLRHDYRDVSDRVIFEVVVRHLPTLKAAIIAIDATLDEPEE